MDLVVIRGARAVTWGSGTDLGGKSVTGEELDVSKGEEESIGIGLSLVDREWESMEAWLIIESGRRDGVGKEVEAIMAGVEPFAEVPLNEMEDLDWANGKVDSLKTAWGVI